MGRRNLESMRSIDAAWNRRQWADYAALLDDDLIAWMSGDVDPHDKAEHVLRAQRFCAMFPDCLVSESYVDIFLSLDGKKTCSIARLTGSAPSDGRSFDVSFAVICKWRDGRIVEQREYFDRELFERQLTLPREAKGDH
ncbi:ester cyclase [Mesorhizobium sp. BH1-1-5]|uniref:nuclear transport factor 2 family protein n=1 Tax=Mesorhizobium sp. BH1-1-5 TaxID=2876661 RepID=UPI001CCE9D02|nr:ester cyclase [Mesorhizobium sp. BH1-1-5]MBZ9988169.1 ester cyclase [Mesorhizobium sp. BH1-1-5]